MSKHRRGRAALVALSVLGSTPQAPAHSHSRMDYQTRVDAYVPPITAELHGHAVDDAGKGSSLGLSPAGGPCERAYQRALTRSHPSWWDRYEDCVRQEQSR